MEWNKIMTMRNPHEALKRIEEKVAKENLSIQEMEDKVEEYAQRHGIMVEEMAYYPDGESVLGT